MEKNNKLNEFEKRYKNNLLILNLFILFSLFSLSIFSSKIKYILNISWKYNISISRNEINNRKLKYFIDTHKFKKIIFQIILFIYIKKLYLRIILRS